MRDLYAIVNNKNIKVAEISDEDGYGSQEGDPKCRKSQS